MRRKTRTRGARLRRNKLRIQRDQSRSGTKNQRARRRRVPQDHRMQSHLAEINQLSWIHKEQMENLEGGVRRAIEAKRHRKQTAEKGQGKKVRFEEEEQSEETERRGQMNKTRCSAGLVRGRREQVSDGRDLWKGQRQRQRRQRRPWKQRRYRKQRNASGHEYDER